MPQLLGWNTVRFSTNEVRAFKAKWPCSGLADRSYWFQFDINGDLVDTNVPESEDGSAALALSQDALEYLSARDGDRRERSH